MWALRIVSWLEGTNNPTLCLSLRDVFPFQPKASVLFSGREKENEWEFNCGKLFSFKSIRFQLVRWWNKRNDERLSWRIGNYVATLTYFSIDGRQTHSRWHNLNLRCLQYKLLRNFYRFSTFFIAFSLMHLGRSKHSTNLMLRLLNCITGLRAKRRVRWTKES